MSGILIDTHETIKSLKKAGASAPFAEAFTYALYDAKLAKDRIDQAEYCNDPALMDDATFDPRKVVQVFQKTGCTEVLAKAVVKEIIIGVFGEEPAEADKWLEEPQK